MKEKNKFLRVLAVSSLIAALAEGFYFFAPLDKHIFLKLMQITLNAFQAFLFRPSIKLSDAVKALNSDSSMLQIAVTYAYSIAVFIAPICTATTAFRILRLWMQRRLHSCNLRKSEHIFLFGFNEDVKSLLKNHSNKSSDISSKKIVHLVTPSFLSEQEELEYLRGGILVHRLDCLQLSGKKLETALCDINLVQAKQIVLFGNSASENFSMFLTLQKCRSCLSKDVTFYLSSENEDISRIIEDIWDQRKNASKKAAKEAEVPTPSSKELKNPSYETIMEWDTDPSLFEQNFKFFSIPEMKARNMFDTYPLFSYNISTATRNKKPDLGVHMLIVGLGSIGLAVLRQTIWQGVLDSSSEILIDVIDVHASQKMNRVKSMFHESLLTGLTNEASNEIRIGSELVDGSLRIRFHDTEVHEEGFRQLLFRIAPQAQPITYAAVCTSDSNTTMHGVSVIQHFLHQSPHQKGLTPVAARLEFNREMAQFVHRDSCAFREVFPLAVNQDVLQLDYLINDAEQRQSMTFNDMYNSIYNKILVQHQAICLTSNESLVSVCDHDDRNTRKLWNQLTYFQKLSNSSLTVHNAAKEMLLGYLSWYLHPEDSRCFEEYLKQISAKEICGSVQWLLRQCTRPDGTVQIDESLLHDGGAPLQEALRVEHRRWCYFTILEGWGYCQGAKQSDRQLTPYLCNWETMLKEHRNICINDIIPLLVMFCDYQAQSERIHVTVKRS